MLKRQKDKAKTRFVLLPFCIYCELTLPLTECGPSYSTLLKKSIVRCSFG